MENTHTFEAIQLEFSQPEIAVVSLNRPKKHNAMNWAMFEELTTVFDHINSLRDVRVVILKGNGKSFTSGLDIMDANEKIFGKVDEHSEDVGRKAILYHKILKILQDSMTSPEKCRMPVIAAIHGYCVGGGLDLSSACDIRLASKCAKFTIKEVDIGLAADIGSLQRFPKVVGNDAWCRELAYTSRIFGAEEALENGLISHYYEDKEILFDEALRLAKLIASKSPVALVGYKEGLNFSRDHTIEDGLKHVRTVNTALLQSEDNMIAAMALLSKEVPKFSKL
ncbi:unnamed protein product [Moneuplotes crassus]|uniref:Uncharacterized protein n=1 Tax=Euplotes crassus TaxID=5936 RepID=A0AAD1XRY7_EUPCR|nr:unnamed protein product [Moneuplotes crassus]